MTLTMCRRFKKMLMTWRKLLVVCPRPMYLRPRCMDCVEQTLCLFRDILYNKRVLVILFLLLK